MSQYSIGEVAQQFNITVRTLQYYHKKGLLLPASTTDGQRRMYNEQSLKRLKLILLLKELELSLDDIKKLLNDDQQLKSLKLILQLKKENLEQDMHDAKRTVDTINQLQRMIAQHSTSPIEEFTDIHLMMTKSKQLKSFYRRLWLSAGVIGVIQYTSIVISIIHRSALPFVKVLSLLVIYGIGIVFIIYAQIVTHALNQECGHLLKRDIRCIHVSSLAHIVTKHIIVLKLNSPSVIQSSKLLLKSVGGFFYA